MEHDGIIVRHPFGEKRHVLSGHGEQIILVFKGFFPIPSAESIAGLDRILRSFQGSIEGLENGGKTRTAVGFKGDRITSEGPFGIETKVVIGHHQGRVLGVSFRIEIPSEELVAVSRESFGELEGFSVINDGFENDLFPVLEGEVVCQHLVPGI